MSYCINPWCQDRLNPGGLQVCHACGTPLVINDRIRIITPLRSLDKRRQTEIFEVEDAGTSFESFPPGTRRVLKVYTQNDSESFALFKRETEALSLMEHPGIPRSTIDDSFAFTLADYPDELLCICMQKMEGQNLEEWIRTHNSPSQDTLLNWLQQLIGILDHVHTKGYFHRDIKPSNIILQPNGKLALIDFATARELTTTYLAKVSGSKGIASSRDGDFDLTVVYSAGYTPPEQIQGQASPQSDFYALGRTLIHLATGKSPLNLPTDSSSKTLRWRSHAKLDKPLTDFLDWLTNPKPSKRPQNTQIILDYLNNQFKQKIKFNKILHSPFFKVSAALLTGIIIILAYSGFSVAANWYQNQQREIKAKEYFNQGLQYQMKNRWLEAKEAYDRSLQLNPNNPDIYNNFAVLCKALKDLSCTVSSYQKLFKLEPNSATGHYNLGSFYEEQFDFKNAEAQYNQAKLPNGKLMLEALNNLSRLKNLQGDYQSALSLALRGLEQIRLEQIKQPEIQATFYKNIGWALLEQKKYNDALKNLQKSFDSDPSRTETYCLLAKVYTTLGNREEYNAFSEKCVLNYSELPEVKIWQKQLWDERGKGNISF